MRIACVVAVLMALSGCGGKEPKFATQTWVTFIMTDRSQFRYDQAYILTKYADGELGVRPMSLFIDGEFEGEHFVVGFGSLNSANAKKLASMLVKMNE